MNIIFLGSGGGRAMVYTQEKKTSGFFLDIGIKIYVDPGVGSYLNYIFNFKKIFDIKKVDYFFVSHAHLDHAHDLVPFIDYITIGGRKKTNTILLASKSVLEGGEAGPNIGEKHLSYFYDYVVMEKNSEYKLKNNFILKTFKNKHSDPFTFSFRLINEEKNIDIGYVSDSVYFDEIGEFFNGVNVLIVNCLRPFGEKHNYHLTADDTLKILKKTNPKLTILYHMGYKFKGKEVETVKRFIEEGFNVIPAHEGLNIDLKNKLFSYSLKKPYYYINLADLYRFFNLKSVEKQKEIKKREKIVSMLEELRKQFAEKESLTNQTWVSKEELTKRFGKRWR